MTFFRLLKQAWKQTKDNYKKLRDEEKLKSQKLNVKTDWYLIESFIEKVNKNPDLRVTVTLEGGTKIHLSTYKEIKQNEYTRLEY